MPILLCATNAVKCYPRNDRGSNSSSLLSAGKVAPSSEFVEIEKAIDATNGAPTSTESSTQLPGDLSPRKIGQEGEGSDES